MTLTNLNSSFIYNTLEQDALNALLALGIRQAAAENAVKKVVSRHRKPEPRTTD